MAVLTQMADDLDFTEVVQELEEHLRTELRTFLREISIEVTCGGLILRGSAYTFYGKQLAQQEAMRRTHQRVLINHITVN
jgi:osmotically-inducible protein OsmY